MSSASASRNVIGTISRTVVRLFQERREDRRGQRQRDDDRQRAPTRQLAGADREPRVDAGRLGQLDHQHHPREQPERVPVDRRDRDALLDRLREQQQHGADQRDLRAVDALGGDEHQRGGEHGDGDRHQATTSPSATSHARVQTEQVQVADPVRALGPVDARGGVGRVVQVQLAHPLAIARVAAAGRQHAGQRDRVDLGQAPQHGELLAHPLHGRARSAASRRSARRARPARDRRAPPAAAAVRSPAPPRALRGRPRGPPWSRPARAQAARRSASGRSRRAARAHALAHALARRARSRAARP